MTLEVRELGRDRMAEFIGPSCAAFGVAAQPERVARLGSIPELEGMWGACDDNVVVGSAGAFRFKMTVPGGGAVDASGLTIVAVLPTHRRRGLLRQMMRAHLDDALRRGQPIAALFASEGGIYGRFGYGLGAMRGIINLRKAHTAFAAHVAAEPGGSVTLVNETEALATFPLVWDRVRRERPGWLSRTRGWWSARRLSDPDWNRGGRPSLQRALLRIDGRPAAYAIYRFNGSLSQLTRDIPLEIVECVGDSVASTAAIWRYVFGIDLIERFNATDLPPDHPLLYLLAEPARLEMRVSDGLYVRLVDVRAALSARRYVDIGSEPLVFDVVDPFCPWNEGRVALALGAASPTSAEPDIALDVGALGAAYLGGFSFSELAQSGRVTEKKPGALARADVAFRASVLPWCPEQF